MARTPSTGVAPRNGPAAPVPPQGWTFLSNHAHVLIVLARHPEMRMREVALRVGITERGVQRIVAELVEGGYLAATRDGRRNRYQIHGELRLRHPVEAHRTIADLVALGS